MTNQAIEISSLPIKSVSSDGGKIVTVEYLPVGILRVKVNGAVVVTDPRGTVLRPLMAALLS